MLIATGLSSAALQQVQQKCNTAHNWSHSTQSFSVPSLSASPQPVGAAESLTLRPAAGKASMEAKRSLVDKVDAFIFDCDGVIWRGDSVIDGVPETLDWLRSLVCTADICHWSMKFHPLRYISVITNPAYSIAFE